jgi:hypothetical protein
MSHGLLTRNAQGFVQLSDANKAHVILNSGSTTMVLATGYYSNAGWPWAEPWEDSWYGAVVANCSLGPNPEQSIVGFRPPAGKTVLFDYLRISKNQVAIVPAQYAAEVWWWVHASAAVPLDSYASGHGLELRNAAGETTFTSLAPHLLITDVIRIPVSASTPSQDITFNVTNPTNRPLYFLPGMSRDVALLYVSSTHYRHIQLQYTRLSDSQIRVHMLAGTYPIPSIYSNTTMPSTAEIVIPLGVKIE